MATDVRAALEKGSHGLPPGWTWEWFTDVMDVEGGTQPPAATFVDSSRTGYVRLVQIRDFETDAHLTYIPDSPKWRKCSTADVLIGRYGAALGRICTGLTGAYNVALAKVVPSERLHQRFVYYLLNSRYFQAPLIASGARSAQAGFNKDGLAVIPLPLPPLPEQKRIAHILSTLDDKIKLNGRMNATLEAMSRAIFKSWFVDFDPVRQKAAGKQPVGMDARTAALFPDSFEDSEIGEVPKGWQTYRLKDVCDEIFSGGTPSTQEPSYWGGHLGWLSSGETREPFIINTEKTITQAGVDNSSTRLASALSTVVASAGQGHTRGQTSLLTMDTYINQSVISLKAKQSLISDGFLYFDLERRYQQFRRLSDSHSSRGSLTTALLGGIPVVVPARMIIEKFDHQSSVIVTRVVANLHKSRTLATLRDTLLPKLLSGEVRVPEAEGMVGEAVG